MPGTLARRRVLARLHARARELELQAVIGAELEGARLVVEAR